MTISVRLAPPNSVVLIEDICGGEVPDTMNQSLISITDSCIAVGCRAEDDGETQIVLGDLSEVDAEKQLVFDGVLRTPSLRLVIRTVLGVTLLETPVSDAETRLRIWTNDLTEPDQIVIGLI